ncbi:MAG: hypothetical protein AAF621_06980 [Pseudomonadota bacterium]
MSDEFIREVEEDLEKEKFLIFLKKYGLAIGAMLIILLGGFGIYKWNANKHEKQLQNWANRYYEMQKIAKKDPNKPLETELVGPVYQSLLTNTRYQAIGIYSDKSENAFKIITDYSSDNPYSAQSSAEVNYVHALLALNDISARSLDLSFDALEKKVKDYSRQKGAFSHIAHEILISKALSEQKYEKAEYYLELLRPKYIKDATQKRRYEAYKNMLNKHKPLKMAAKTEASS